MKTISKIGVAECCYDLPSSPALLPNGEGSQSSCPLSIGERARVRGISALHISIQQRPKILVSARIPLLLVGVFLRSATVAQVSPSPMMSPRSVAEPGRMMAANTVKFTCSQGKAFVATFQQDKARVILLDTRQDLMMRQVESGSGIQYVNAGYHLFSKGKEASIEINGKPVYENCVTP